MIDPVGAKHADDGDPFGPPPTSMEITAQTVVAAAVFALGLLLVLSAAQQRSARQLAPR